jgi:hypothetical protein
MVNGGASPTCKGRTDGRGFLRSLPRSGVIASLALAAIWLCSSRVIVQAKGPSGYHAGFWAGCLYVGRVGFDWQGLFKLELHDMSFMWGPSWSSGVTPGTFGARLPLWIPLPAVLAMTVKRRRVHRIVQSPCSACGYELANLGAGVCPECGLQFEPSR